MGCGKCGCKSHYTCISLAPSPEVRNSRAGGGGQVGHAYGWKGGVSPGPCLLAEGQMAPEGGTTALGNVHSPFLEGWNSPRLRRSFDKASR